MENLYILIVNNKQVRIDLIVQQTLLLSNTKFTFQNKAVIGEKIFLTYHILMHI